MKRETDNFGGSGDRAYNNAERPGRQRRRGKRAATVMGLLAAMAAVVYLTVAVCSWLDSRAQQSVAGAMAGNPGGAGGNNPGGADNPGGGNPDGAGSPGGGNPDGTGSQGGANNPGGGNQDGAGNKDDGSGIVDAGGSAVNGDKTPSGSGDDTVDAAGRVSYSQEELESMISAAVQQAQNQALEEVRENVKNSLDAGDSLLQALRLVYTDDLVVASGGKHHVVPINRELKMHDFSEENLNILETGEYQYMRDGQVVSYKGIDVSQHQGVIDWQQVAADGVQFAFIRAAYRGYGYSGRLVADANFDANMKGATENGIKVGVYIYSQAITPEEAVEEANFVLERVAPYNVECPIVFDVETVAEPSGRMNLISPEERTNYALLFCQTIENAGYRPMIYYNTEMGAMKLDLAKLEGYDKWFAAYTDEFYYPYAYDVWQYSSKGSVAGIKGNVDLNISFVPIWEKKTARTEDEMNEIKEPIYYAKASVDTMMRKFAAKDLPPKGRFHYHQGVFLSGVYKTYEECGEEAYYQYVKDWVDSCLKADGIPIKYDTGQLDDLQPGILAFPLYERTKDEKYKKLLDNLVSVIKAFPRNEEGGFWHKDKYPNQMWLDGLYMGGPICAEYGARFDAPEFFDLVAEQALLMRDKTIDVETGLWYHAYDSKKTMGWADPETGKSPEFWGRSIGWVTVALLDDLDFIPADHPKYEEIKSTVAELIKAVCKYQSEDGRWYQVVDKGDAPENWLENSCSCLYTAAIAKAVRTGILPEEYLDYAKKGYEGVIRSLQWNGDDLLINNVCVGTGVGDYTHYINRGTSENDLHGVGAFLIMCTEMQKVW